MTCVRTCATRARAGVSCSTATASQLGASPRRHRLLFQSRRSTSLVRATPRRGTSKPHCLSCQVSACARRGRRHGRPGSCSGTLFRPSTSTIRWPANAWSLVWCSDPDSRASWWSGRSLCPAMDRRRARPPSAHLCPVGRTGGMCSNSKMARQACRTHGLRSSSRVPPRTCGAVIGSTLGGTADAGPMTTESTAVRDDDTRAGVPRPKDARRHRGSVCRRLGTHAVLGSWCSEQPGTRCRALMR